MEAFYLFTSEQPDGKTEAVSEWSTLATAMAVGSARLHWSIGADLAIAAAKAVNSDAAQEQ